MAGSSWCFGYTFFQLLESAHAHAFDMTKGLFLEKITIRGMKEIEVAHVANLIHEAWFDQTNTAKLQALRERVSAFDHAFPLPW